MKFPPQWTWASHTLIPRPGWCHCVNTVDIDRVLEEMGGKETGLEIIHMVLHCDLSAAVEGIHTSERECHA